MNPYLSREEKNAFVRLSALAAHLEEVISGYEQSKKTDKSFMKFLKSSRTFLDKALDLRIADLEPQAKVNFVRQVKQIQLVFTPNAQAKQEFETIKSLQSTVPMDIDDFNDLYSVLLEEVCRSCRSENYQECQLRKILMKYEVYPYNPAAEKYCQYSYVEDEPGVIGDIGIALLQAHKKKRPAS